MQLKLYLMRYKFLIAFLIITSCIISVLPDNNNNDGVDCTKLRLGQFFCPDPDSSYDYIDHKTQSVIGCTKNGTAKVRCIAAEGIVCRESGNNTFSGTIPCDYT